MRIIVSFLCLMLAIVAAFSIYDYATIIVPRVSVMVLYIAEAHPTKDIMCICRRDNGGKKVVRIAVSVLVTASCFVAYCLLQMRWREKISYQLLDDCICLTTATSLKRSFSFVHAQNFRLVAKTRLHTIHWLYLLGVF